MRGRPMRYWPLFALLLLLLELQSVVRQQSQLMTYLGGSSSSSTTNNETSFSSPSLFWKNLTDFATSLTNMTNSVSATTTTADSTTTDSTTTDNDNHHHQQRQQQYPLIPSNNTLVTAFLPTPTRRHSLQDYLQLFERTFSLHDHMVIITTPELVSNLTSIRQTFGPHDPHSQRTVYWTRQLNDTRLAQDYPLEFWQKFVTGGTFHAHYSTFWVWSEKMQWLAEVAQANPFDSQFFGWIDAGMIRWDEYQNKTLLQRIPPQLQPNQFMVLNVTSTTKNSRNRMMGAGIMGGYKEGVLRYRDAYFETVRAVYNETKDLHTQQAIPLYDISMASEQHLMYRTCMDNVVNDTHFLCLPILPKRVRNSPLGGPLRFPIFWLLPFLDAQMFQQMQRMGIVQDTWGPYTSLV